MNEVLNITLALKFIKERRQDFVEDYLRKSKKSLESLYGDILANLGFDKVFSSDFGEDKSLLAQSYVYYMADLGLPLYDFEQKILETLGDESKEQVKGKIRNMPAQTLIGDHNLEEDKYYKVTYAARFIAKSFDNETEWYKETSESKLKARLTKFINQKFDIILEDTNVALSIPASFPTQNIKIYIPKDCVLSPLDFLLNEVMSELKEPKNFGLSSSMYSQVVSIFAKTGSLYYFFKDDSSISTMFYLDIYSRQYGFDTIENYLKPSFTLGEPMEVEGTITQVTALGNSNNTISLLVGKNVVTVDKANFGMVIKVLKKYKTCTIKKMVGVAKEEEKVLLWDLIYSNSKPVDGNYNNITKKNVQ